MHTRVPGLDCFPSHQRRPCGCSREPLSRPHLATCKRGSPRTQPRHDKRLCTSPRSWPLWLEVPAARRCVIRATCQVVSMTSLSRESGSTSRLAVLQCLNEKECLAVTSGPKIAVEGCRGVKASAQTFLLTRHCDYYDCYCYCYYYYYYDYDDDYYYLLLLL